MSEYELRLILNSALDEYLPDFTEAVVAPVFSDVGSISLKYKVNGLNYGLLNTEECEVALTRNGTEVDNGRFVMQDDDGDELEENGTTRTFTGRSAGWAYLQDGLVYSPNGSTTVATPTVFSSATVGTIMSTLLQRAQTRGACTLIDYSTFTTALDSAGASWTKVINIAYDPGVTLLQVLQNLVDQGMCEVKWVGRSLRIHNPDTIGTDRTVQAEPVILRAGKDFKEAPKRRSSREVANVILIRGDNDVLRERTDATSLGARRRREQFVSQGGVSDNGTLNVIADTHLSLKADPRIQNTFGVALTSESPRPFGDYFNGDYIFCDKNQGAGNERQRVRQISLTLKADGTDPDLAIVLNDRITEQEIALARKVQGITGGAALGGGSTAVAQPTTTDRLAPAAPGAPTVSSAAYVNTDGITLAQATISWAQVTTNADTTAITDLGGYEVQYARVSGQWVPLGRVDASTTTAYMSSLPVGITLYARVRAYDTNGNAGAWSSAGSATMASDATPPPAPSTPTVDGSAYLGTLKVTWDGKDNGGAAMPADFAYLEVHASSVNNFTPSVTAGSSTKIDEFGAPAVPATTVFQAPVGTVMYVKFVAVDKSGNRSTASAQGSGTARAGVDADFASISAGKITAGTLSADVIVGARIKTANTGARAEMNTVGFQAFNSSSVETFRVEASTGKVLIAGTLSTAVSGDRIELGTGISGAGFGGGGTSSTVEIRFLNTVANETGKIQWYSLSASARLRIMAEASSGNSGYIDLTDVPASFTGDAAMGVGSTSNMLSEIRCSGNIITINAVANQIQVTGTLLVAQPDTSIYSYGGAYQSSGNLCYTARATSGGTTYQIYADNVGTYGGSTTRMWFSTNAANGTGEMHFGPRAGSTYLNAATIRTQAFYVIGNAVTTAAAANMFWNTDNTIGAIGRSTSSLKYKEKIRPFTKPEWRVLDLVPFKYKSKGAMDTDFGKESSRDFIGLAAEDADELGLFELVDYNADGEPDWLMYERLTALLLPIVKDINNRLLALEGAKK